MQEIRTHAIIYYISVVSSTTDNPQDELAKRIMFKSETPEEDILGIKSLDKDIKRWNDGGKHYVKDALDEESDRYRVVIYDDDKQTPVNDCDFVTSVVSGMDGEVWVFPVLAEIGRGLEGQPEE